MILDRFENLSSYVCLNTGFKKAFAFLCRKDLEDLPAGKYEIDGEKVFAIIVNEPGQEIKEGPLEVHNKYVDIQYVVSGTDEMGWKPKKSCVLPDGDFDTENDAGLFKDSPDTWISVQPGCYAIFFPEDAHMAMFSKGNIHKVIIKVEVDTH